MDDVIGPLLSKLTGVNIWITGTTSYLGSKDLSIDPSKRIAFTLKYGPFRFGSEAIKTEYQIINRKIQSSASTIDSCSGAICKNCIEILDTIVMSDTVKKDTVRYSQTHKLIQGKNCDTCCPSRAVNASYSFEKQQSLTVAFGYSYAPSTAISRNSAFRVSMPLQGAIAQLLFHFSQSDALKNLTIGIGGTVLSMGKGGGTLFRQNQADTVRFDLETETIFAPQASIGYGLSITSDFTVFADVGAEFARFDDLKFTFKTPNITLDSVAADVPDRIDVSNLFVRVGLSINLTPPED